MRKILSYLLLIFCLSLSAQSTQEIRSLSIVANDTVVEKLTLPAGERGMEVPVTLKFCFDETANTVTVIAESSANIFGLQAGARYSNIIQGGNLFHRGGKFMAEKLAYDVQMDPSNSYRVSKFTRKSIGKPKVRKNYYFHRWIESDNMDMRTAKTNILGKQMVQVFSVASKQEKATVSLRDIFTIDHKGATPRKWKKLLFTLHKDLNITYELQLVHNPCFGLDKEIDSAKTKTQSLKEKYEKLNSDFSATTPLNPPLYESFMNRRDSLIASFPQQLQKSDCADLQEVYDEYNTLVDKVIKMRRELNIPAASNAEVVGSLLGAKHLDANALQFKARQLDELVGKYMLTTDPNERLNIRRQCQKIVSDTAKLADGKVIKTDEQRHAVKTFQNALEFYRKNIK